MMVRTAASLFAVLLFACPSALAQGTATGGALSEAAEGLSSSTVYVDPGAEMAISDEEAERLRARIRSGRGGWDDTSGADFGGGDFGGGDFGGGDF